ncbi:hypothetical protein BJN34_09545 [Cupriavidus necator]|uniref:Uncharacterized protein n=1 Tax=Cupriavidus necator TaxID=106590 RepID=A0A1U9UN73_CUPNE|nr:hypothetical protein BJN34_09545 [Cupriavidus necator]
MCGLLFFRYGVTPTANKRYSLVHKGSMGTPAEVLQPRGVSWPNCVPTQTVTETNVPHLHEPHKQKHRQ